MKTSSICLHGALFLLSACGYIGYETPRGLPSGGMTPGDDAASNTALAAAANIGVGDGHWGPLVLSSAQTVVNAYSPLSAETPAGSTSIEVQGNVSTFRVQQGDLVMLWQSTGWPSNAAASGNAGPLSLATYNVGHWEWQRVRSTSPGRIELQSGTIHAYAASGAQVILVPEYSRVEVATGASIAAQPWNGVTGGIVVFLAAEEIQLEGTIAASGAGFRGGRGSAGQDFSCSGLDDIRSGFKGEGVVLESFAATARGRGNVGNGGGGGSCWGAGGGGGAHAAAGGKGGRTPSVDGSRDAGGLGGSPLSYALPQRLSMGGAGGSGHTQFEGVEVAGGEGGGIVFLRTPVLRGLGSVDASGGEGRTVISELAVGPGGGGGGGAGGVVLIQATQSLAIAALRARGGGGGSTSFSNDSFGPGGGGGGGIVHLESSSIAASVDVAGGGSGSAEREDTGQTSNRNASVGDPGRSEQLPGS